MIVLVLHLLQHDYNPLHQMMSELALGQRGEYMLAAFIAMATALLALAALLFDRRQSITGTLLAAAGGAFAAAGVFRLDNALELHVGLVAMAFILSGVVMYLLPRVDTTVSATISWTLAALMACSVLAGHLGVPMGLAQRAAAGCLLAWLGWIAMTALKR